MPKQHDSTTRKPRLGRGLSGLVVNSSDDASQDSRYVPTSATPENPDTPAPSLGDRSSRAIPVTDIALNPYQPRRNFAPDDLATLAESIRTRGILQPLVVSPTTDRDAERPYVLIAGERRLRAARQAGLDTVPCLIRTASPIQMLEWALVENIHRTDLDPIERAQAYHEYIERFDLTQAQAAEKLAQPRPTVANYLRLLDLCDHVQRLVIDRALSFGHAKVLAGLAGDEASQREVAAKIVAESLSVRQTEQLVAAARSGLTPRAGAPKTRPATPRPAYLSDIEERLCQAVGTRVKVIPARRKDRGRIVVEYYSLDDFERIAAALGVRSADQL